MTLRFPTPGNGSSPGDPPRRRRISRARLSRALAATPWGIEALPVEVEVDVRNGLPTTQLVGLPDTAVRESRERVRAAIHHCGFTLPARAVVINLAPADLRKEGNHLDLAIGLGLLAGHDLLPRDVLAGRLLCGELGLDGAVRPIRGALAIAELAQRLGVRELLLPPANAAQAACLDSCSAIPVRSLSEAVEHLVGVRAIRPATPALGDDPAGGGADPDLAEVAGQELARRALEIAAAGGHNLLMVGPPGSGKTMLARRLPGILPPLERQEAITITNIHSLAGHGAHAGLMRRRPFRSPHSGISAAGLIGGGPIPRPGEVSLAHGGVLFLDELPEFRRDVLESLRQPVEDGRVWISRAKARLSFPARFALVAAMNPCPCGYLDDPRHDCRCSPAAVARYAGRISGPLLDRIDLHVGVHAVRLDELRGARGEASAAIAERVLEARARQHRRNGAGSRGEPRLNSSLGPARIHVLCAPEAAGQRLLGRAFDALGLSVRSLHRILRVARTIADLDDAPQVAARHVAEAIQFRAGEERGGPPA
jgi:magnesium chelatase family protein